MSLFTPEFGLVFWMLVVFLILFGILAKYAWPAIVRMMDERADFIDKGVEYAREAKRDREKAQEDAKDLLTEARKQQLEVLQQTERLKREMIAEARKAAENEAKQVREAANLSIEQAKREAELHQRPGQHRFAHAGHVLNEHMASGNHGREQQAGDPFFTHQHFLDICLDSRQDIFHRISLSLVIIEFIITNHPKEDK